MIRNDYRRALIMLRGLDKGLTGHVRLERRTLTGTMQFSVSGVSGDSKLYAALLGRYAGRWSGAVLGALGRDGRGQAGLNSSFDPRNISGLEFEQCSLIVIVAVEKNSAHLAMFGYVNGTVDVDWAQVHAVATAFFAKSAEVSRPVPLSPSIEAPEPVSVGDMNTEATAPASPIAVTALPESEADDEECDCEDMAQAPMEANKKEPISVSVAVQEESPPIAMEIEVNEVPSEPISVSVAVQEECPPIFMEEEVKEVPMEPISVSVAVQEECPPIAMEIEVNEVPPESISVSVAVQEESALIAIEEEVNEVPPESISVFMAVQEESALIAMEEEVNEAPPESLSIFMAVQEESPPIAMEEEVKESPPESISVFMAVQEESAPITMKEEHIDLAADQSMADMEWEHSIVITAVTFEDGKLNDASGNVVEMDVSQMPAGLLLDLDITVPWPPPIEALRSVFLREVSFTPFEAPGYVFVRAPLPSDTQIGYCAVGIKCVDKRPSKVCYGIPGTFALEPPPGLEGYAWRGGGIDGFWTIFLDAESGEEVDE